MILELLQWALIVVLVLCVIGLDARLKELAMREMLREMRETPIPEFVAKQRENADEGMQ